jgi:hypothetical protein
MTDINDELSGSKTPPSVKFEKVGDKHVILVASVRKVPVREFVKGKPGDQLYFQGQKLVRESDLVLQLPYEAVPAWLVVGELKDGTPVSLRLEGERLKATKKAIREGGRLEENGMIAIEFSEEEDTGAPYPKKKFVVQLKGAQAS